MGTLTSEISRIKQAKTDLKQAINEKGVTVADTALIDEYDEAVKAIEVGTGGGGGEVIVSGETSIVKSRILWGR
jgi:endonuclease YncB( thermonuclease family)